MAEKREDARAVRTYFEGGGVSFDTFYDGRRGALVRWLDRKFRYDVLDRFRIAFNAFGDLRGKTFLDVGCGSGPYVVEALRRGASRVVGVDLSGTMLALAREKVAAMGMTACVELVQADFASWEPGERFDAAVVMGVMDYVGDAATFMRKVANATSARAAVSFPSISWWRSPIRRVRYLVKRCPLYLYDRRRVEAAVEGCGARDVEIIKIPGAGMDYVVLLDFE
ncbi:MAG: methyltransferase domain-containing protein [candidate division Zixibacteria bacterium]|nr:methyltransferase domain-containing protein [candidate division Zixibacteria bacterium]